MPYLQPATANYFGFAPAEQSPGNIQINPYVVSSSEGAIYAGDIVIYSTTLSTIRPAPAGTISSSQAIVGVAAGFLAANGGSTAATLTANSSQLLNVYDNPGQLFVACCTTSFIIGSTAVGKAVAVLTSGAVGSTGPNTASLNRSVMALSGATASSGGCMRLIGLHPIENLSYSTDAGGAGVAASARKWLVIPVNHMFAPGVGSQVTT